MRTLIPFLIFALLVFGMWAMDRAERAAGMERHP